MSWNYRVIRYDTDDGHYYAIHDVYYNEGGTPDGHAIKERAGSESLDGLREVLKLMEGALAKPVLEFKPESGYTEVE